jgi:hypothetical protein
MLVNCPECKREVSDQAAACPHCGYSRPKPSPYAHLPSYQAGMRSARSARSATPTSLGRGWLIASAIGVVVLALVALLILAKLAPAPAVAAGWSTDFAVVQERFSYAMGSLAGWSPMISESDRSYHAIWYDSNDRDNQIRAYVDDAGALTAIALTGSNGDQEAKDARTIVDVAIPSAPADDRASTAAALAKLAGEGKPANITIDGVTFSASAGLFHHTYRAGPASGPGP